MTIMNNHVQQTLSGLNYDFQQFTVDDFTTHIEKQRERKIFMLGHTLPHGFYGAWLTDKQHPFEYIFFNQSLSPIHQVHTQLHELSHFLLGHQTAEITDSNQLTSLIESVEAGHWSPQFEGALMRTHNQKEQSVQEEEAETLSSEIQARVIRQSSVAKLAKAVSRNEDAANYLRTIGVI